MITTRSFQRHARWAERTSEHILTRRLDEGWGTTVRLDRHAARDGLRLGNRRRAMPAGHRSRRVLKESGMLTGASW